VNCDQIDTYWVIFLLYGFGVQGIAAKLLPFLGINYELLLPFTPSITPSAINGENIS